VYLVIDDFGRNGRVYREADVETTDLETVILDMLEGQYKSPVRVIAFNTAEKWSQDVAPDVARALRQRCDLQMRAAIFRCVMCRSSCRTFRSNTKAGTTTIGYPY
jgi:hypothetical protein